MNCIRSSSSTDSSRQSPKQQLGSSTKSSSSRLQRLSRPMSPVSTAPSSTLANHASQNPPKQAVEMVEDCEPELGELGIADEDFDLIDVSDELPTRKQLDKARDILVYDSEGHSRPFKSLYLGEEYMGQRQLIVFVRHFYCGACQAYLKALTATFTPNAYFSLPIPTKITVIGCGSPNLIPRYITRTNCPFRVYADPTRKLYKALGMIIAIRMGSPNEYTNHKSASQITIESFVQMGRSPRNEIFKGGNMIQMGGEFLFEESRPIWCHRMRNPRDHSEMNVLKRVLEMPDVDDEDAAQDTDEEDLREQERRRAPSQNLQQPEPQPQPQQMQQHKKPKSRQRARSNASKGGELHHDEGGDEEDPVLTALPLSSRASVSLPGRARSRSNTASSRQSTSQGQPPGSSGGLKVIWDGKGQGHLGRESRMGIV